MSAKTANDAHEMRIAMTDGHEVSKRHNAVRRFKSSFEDESVIQITPPAGRRIFRRNRPASVFFLSNQRSETCRRREMRPAKPVNRASVADESHRLAVTDHCVVLDASRHIALNVDESGRMGEPTYLPGLSDFR
jgi:hypothetical protein